MRLIPILILMCACGPTVIPVKDARPLALPTDWRKACVRVDSFGRLTSSWKAGPGPCGGGGQVYPAEMAPGSMPTLVVELPITLVKPGQVWSAYADVSGHVKIHAGAATCFGRCSEAGEALDAQQPTRWIKEVPVIPPSGVGSTFQRNIWVECRKPPCSVGWVGFFRQS